MKLNINLFLIVLIFVLGGYIIWQRLPAKSPQIIPTGQTQKENINEASISSYPTENKMFCFQGEYPNGSCLQAVDINNDGREELLYLPRGASWRMTSIVLKESPESGNYFLPFCENCVFKSYNSSIILKDIDGDNDLDIIIPTVADDNWNFKFEIYQWNGRNFKLKDTTFLPQNPQKQSQEVEKILKNYGL